MMILKEFSRIVCVSLFSYQGSLLVCLTDSLFTLPHLIDCVKYFFEVFYFFKIQNLKRRRRDLNPRAAINDLLPFQGSPFGQLGYFSKLPYLLSKFFIKLFLLSCDSLFSITDVPLFVKHFLNLFFKVFN